MKKLAVFGLGVVLSVAFSSIVMAEGAPKAEGAAKPRVDAFKKADANADGKLSLEEFKTMSKKDADKKFTDADTDKDGFLTKEELKAARKNAVQDKVKEKHAEKDAAVAPVVEGAAK